MGVSKDGTITIDGEDFMKGIGDSPLVGNGFMKHCDIYSKPGAIKATGETTAITFDTAPTGEIINIFADEGGDYWAITEENELYEISGTSATKVVPGTGTPSTQDVEGAIAWKGYIIIFISNKIDLYDPSSNTWYPNWASYSLSGSGWKSAIVGSDDVVYFGENNKIHSITEDTTFDPSNAATYTVAEALDLPDKYKVKCLAEYNNNLVIGTWSGANVFDINIANIFFWDFVSTSFDGPLQLNENGINQMIVADNLIYIVAGLNHRIYVSNGVSIEEIKELNILASDSQTFMLPKPNAIMYHKNIIYTATGRGTGTTSDYDRPMGVYSIDRQRSLIFQNTISTGRTNGGIGVSALLSTGRNTYYLGWYDSQETPSYGIDRQTDFSYYDNNSVEFVSRLYTVGTKINKRTFQEIEIGLMNKVSDFSQGISVYYREFPEDSWTQVGGKITDSGHSEFNSFIFPFAPMLESIQVKVVIDEVNSPTRPIELKRIIIKSDV